MDLRVLIVLLVTYTVEGKLKDCQTCRECISFNSKTAWCRQEDYDGDRCQLKDRLIHTECRYNMEAPPEKRLVILKKKPLRPKRPITPQKVNLELRRGASATLPIELLARKDSLVLKFRYPRAVKLHIESNCTGFEWKNKIATCNGVARGKVHFKLDIQLRRCLPRPKKIKATVDGNKKKSLKIFLKSRCDCECEQVQFQEFDSPKCSENGNLVCGTCTCYEGYYGQRCECAESEPEPEVEEDIARCTIPNTTSICSGRGDCIRGQCNCHPRSANSAMMYSGAYCECDNYSCDYFDNQLCGGEDRGVCKCGMCLCEPGYSGEACDFSLATAKCMGEHGEICSGRGRCVNNVCECNREISSAGPACEYCPDIQTCPGKCNELKPCVQCEAFQSGPYSSEECNKRCRGHSPHIVDRVQGTRTFNRQKACKFKDDDDCVVHFVYYFMRGVIRMDIQRTKVCPPP